MVMSFRKADAEQRVSVMRAAKKAANEARYRIENEYVTVREIAARVGISRSNAHKKMQALKRASGAITWARLSA